MGKPSKAIEDFRAKYGIDSDEIWEVHGTSWVVKHKALERVAVEQGIVWDKPELKVCDMTNGFVAILISGKLGEHVEYSFGEASPKNNKNAYPVAMAEKRAKDRVILKLLAAHGDLYSEEEADDFKRQNPHVTDPEDIFDPAPDDIIPAGKGVAALAKKDSKEIYKRLQDELQSFDNWEKLEAWGATIGNRVATLPLDWQKTFKGQYKEFREYLQTRQAAE